MNDTAERSSVEPLPADDPALMTADLRELVRRWSATGDRTPISAAAMTGADRKAQALGVPGGRLMEHAGTAVAAAARAVAADQGRLGRRADPRPVRAGQQRRRRARGGASTRTARPAGRRRARVDEERPTTPDAARNWDRLAGEPSVTRIHAAVPRDVAILAQGIEKAGVVVDALLGTGVRGALREPIRSAVELIRRAREAGVPVVAVDTPTAVDLTSGEPSDPAVRADLTVTFHRPKTGPADQARGGARRPGPRRPDRDPGRRPIVAERSSSAGATVVLVAVAVVGVVLGLAFAHESAAVRRPAARAPHPAPDRRSGDRDRDRAHPPRAPTARAMTAVVDGAPAATSTTLASERWDLLVVGGGITGSGVVLDAASRGLRAALSSATTTRSGPAVDRRG